MSLRSSTKSTPPYIRLVLCKMHSSPSKHCTQTPRYLASCRSSPSVRHTTPYQVPCPHALYFLGLGIFSYAFGLGALFGFLFDLPLASPALWSCSQLSWSCECSGCLPRLLLLLGRAVLLSGSLSESSSLELSLEDSSLDSPASRGAWYMQHTKPCQRCLLNLSQPAAGRVQAQARDSVLSIPLLLFFPMPSLSTTSSAH